MKKRSAMFLAAAMAAFGAWAATETVGDYTWTYRINGDTAEIYNNGSVAISPSPTGAVTIPSTLGGKTVTSIGSSAFSGCSGLTSVTIPDSVTSIGDWAFAGCSGLTSVTIPDSVTSIGDYAFYNCSGLTSVTIGNSVTNIGYMAFSGCSGLADLDGVVIVNNILYDYYGVGGVVTVPKGVTGIGNHAFEGCYGLIGVVIPDSVTYIGDSAFEGCRLTSVTLPDSVTRIEHDAFEGCGGLMSVTIPDSVTSIGSEAFRLCSGLTSVTIGKGVKSIEEMTFGGCGLTSVTIPDSVTNIGWAAFSECVGLTSVTIPDSVTSIGDEAFYGCSGLTSVTMRCDCPTVGEDAFYEVDPSCVVHLPEGNATYVVTAGKWQGMTVQYYGGSGGDSGDEGSSPPAPAPTPTPGSVVVPELYDETEIAGTVPTAAASVYDGCLVDARGNVAGSIQVKVGKPNAKTGLAAVKATVVVGAAKASLKGADKGKAVMAEDGPTTMRLVGGESCEVTLGAEGLSGSYGSYLIDGARNFFSSKDKGEQDAANGLLAKWLGPVNVVWDGGNASVAIGKKGKAKVAVTLADGTKATANAQLLVGDEWLCVPVVVTKKANLAFALWLPRSGGAAVVEGLSGDVVVGKPGALAANAAFRVGKSAALWQQIPGTVLADYLPDGMAVTQSGAKWTLPKAGKVQKAKDGTIDSSKLGENPSALKLTYKAKDGSFKGSFKVYADNGGKLKATTVNVSGIVVGGVGYGTATIKKVGSVPVKVE